MITNEEWDWVSQSKGRYEGLLKRLDRLEQDEDERKEAIANLFDKVTDEIVNLKQNNKQLQKQLNSLTSYTMDHLDKMQNDAANYVREAMGLPRYHEHENKIPVLGKEGDVHLDHRFINPDFFKTDPTEGTKKNVIEENDPVMKHKLPKWQEIETMKVDGNDINVVGYVKVNKEKESGDKVTNEDLYSQELARYHDFEEMRLGCDVTILIKKKDKERFKSYFGIHNT